MVAATGFDSLDALVDATVPKAIRRPDLMDLGEYTHGMRESEFLTKFKCARSRAPLCSGCKPTPCAYSILAQAELCTFNAALLELGCPGYAILVSAGISCGAKVYEPQPSVEHKAVCALQSAP